MVYGFNLETKEMFSWTPLTENIEILAQFLACQILEFLFLPGESLED